MAERMDPKLAESSGEHSPGAHLRQAREAANMSVAEVADALFLHPDKIEALESDAFEPLAAPTFVRGYLRGYARLLGLPSAPILEMYDRQGFGPPPLALETSEPKQAHTSDLPIRLATYAVGAVLVLLVGLWWWSQRDAGFDLGDNLLGWWSDAAAGLSFPGAEAPATAPAGDEADRGSSATAPDRIGAPSRRDGPPALPPAEGPATAGVPPDATAPDGSDSAGRTVAMAPDRAGGPTHQDREPPVSPPAEGPATAGFPPDAPAPDGSGAGGRIIAMTPDRTGGPAQSAEPPASASAEGPAIAGTGPVPAEGAGPGSTTDRGASAAPGPRPEVAAGADPATVADPDEARRPQAPAPRETHAVATDGPEATAAPGAAAPPSIPGASPSGTDSALPDIAAVTSPVVETAQPGLVLAFAHESWVEVFDRERNRLFFGLVQPGRVLDFDGPQPFDVLLGNSKDVRVVIDGEAFDHTPYVRHSVARFNVGAAPAGGADAAGRSDTVAADAADSREAPPRPRDDPRDDNAR